MLCTSLNYIKSAFEWFIKCMLLDKFPCFYIEIKTNTGSVSLKPLKCTERENQVLLTALSSLESVHQVRSSIDSFLCELSWVSKAGLCQPCSLCFALPLFSWDTGSGLEMFCIKYHRSSTRKRIVNLTLPCSMMCSGSQESRQDLLGIRPEL